MRLLKYMTGIIGISLSLTAAPAFSQYFDDCNSCCEDNSGGFKVYADYLYWKVVQDQIPYAGILEGGVEHIFDIIEEGPPLTISEVAKVVDQSFKFDSGFRVGLGYEFPCSGWDLNLEWSSLHEKNSSRTVYAESIIPTAAPATIVFGFINLNPSQFHFADEATSHWKFEYDVVDLTFGSNYTLASCFKVHPYIGLKFARIDQTQTIQYFGFELNEIPVDILNHKKNHFRGIGPSFGIDTAWNLFSGLNLCGSVSGALLCGKFDSNEHPFVTFTTEDLTTNEVDTLLHSSKKNRIRPYVDGKIGFDYSTCFCDNFHLNLGIFYEMQYWWNQWQTPPSGVAAALNGGLAPQGDLYMQGLTVHLGLGF